MRKSLLKKSLVLVAALAASFSASAQTQITDAAGLAAVANDLAGDYVLAADITLSGEWTPIGSPAAPFTGTFDGAGHSIKGLTITGDNSGVGLFGNLEGLVKNVRIVAANVRGNEHVGIVAGRLLNDGVIDGVFTSGIISGRDHEGAIVGHIETAGTVSNCLSTAYVDGREYQGGGIAGWSKGINALNNNIFLGTVRVGAWGGCGGIVGFYEQGTTTVTGNVCAAVSLTGQYGELPVSGNNRYTHGIAGGPLNDESILYAQDNLLSEETKIFMTNGTELFHADMDETHNGVDTPVSELKKAATYTAIGYGSAWSLADGRFPVLASMSVPFDGDYIITNAIPEEAFTDNVFETNAFSPLGKAVKITSSNPAAVSVNGTQLSFVGAGEAKVTLSTEADGFTNAYSVEFNVKVQDMDTNIATAADLEKIRKNPTADFQLTADIDMTGVDFTPLPDYTGVFDGQGHVIKGLRFVNANQDNAGLFSTTHNAIIKNLGITEAHIVGNANAAGIVGRAYGGNIANCYVTNSYIEGRDHVGAIAGDVNQDGGEGCIVEDCVSDARIFTRQFQAGGIAGVINCGIIQRTLFTGIVDSNNTTNVTAIVSLLDADTYPSEIANNMSAPAHMNNATPDLGDARLIGLYSRSITMYNNYIIKSSLINGGRSSNPGDANGASGEQVDDEVAKTRDFYVNTLGWDFDNTWTFFEGTEGKAYPVLKTMKAPVATVIFDMPNDETLTYENEYSYMEMDNMHASWGQPLSFEIVEGGDYAEFEDGYLYAGKGGVFNGEGDVVIKVNLDPAVADKYNVVGGNTFTIYVAQSGAVKKIATVEDFLNIGKNLGGKYELTADIDLRHVTFGGFATNGKEFTGELDGKGHKVIALSVSGTGGSDFGVFGKTMGATIKNIAFEDFRIINQSANHVGFVGSAQSTVFDQVGLNGMVWGNDHVAVLAGDADDVTVTNCMVYGYVYAYSQVGGFFGCTLATGANVQNSYFNGELNAYTRGWVGGVVGLIDKAGGTVTIEHCASIGDCHSFGDGSPHVVAPFIGGNRAGGDDPAEWNIINFHDNIYNATAIMDGDTDWPINRLTADGGDVEAAVGVSAEALKQESTYTDLGWDFQNIWQMGNEAYPWPVLKNAKMDPVLGIKNVDSDAARSFTSGKTYNIMGQQVDGTVVKGIVIRDGRKFIVK